jgi:hypothetical protein
LIKTIRNKRSNAKAYLENIESVLSTTIESAEKIYIVIVGTDDIEKAEREFQIYREREMRMLESDFDKAIKRLKDLENNIP